MLSHTGGSVLWGSPVTAGDRTGPLRDGWGSLMGRMCLHFHLPQPRLGRPVEHRSPECSTPCCSQPSSTDLRLAWLPPSVRQGSLSQDGCRLGRQLPVTCQNSRPQEEMQGSARGMSGPPGALEGHPGDRNVCTGPSAPNKELPRRSYSHGNGHAPGATGSPRGGNQQGPRTHVLKTFQPQAEGLASGWDPEPGASLQRL